MSKPDPILLAAIEFAIKELIGDLRGRHDDVMADELLQKWESQTRS